MDEKQLRELIRLMGQASALRMVLGSFGGGRKPSGDDQPTGLKKFMRWVTGKIAGPEPSGNEPGTIREQKPAAVRVDEIIKATLAKHDAPPAPKQASEADIAQIAAETGLPADQVQAMLASGKMRFKGDAQPAPNPVTPKDAITGVIDTAVKNKPVRQDAIPGMGVVNNPKPKAEKEPSRMSSIVDAVQLGLDAVGVVDPTPISDGANAAISLGRAFITDPERRKEHLQNAAISVAGMVPYIGDTAKLAKLPRAAKTMQRVSKGVPGAEKATAAVGKVVSSAEKRMARTKYRATARQVTDAVMGPDADQSLDAAAGGNGGRIPPSGVGTQPPDGDNNNPRRDREESEGIAEHDAWRDKLKAAGDKVADFGGIIGKAVKGAAAFVTGLHVLNTGVLALNRDLAPYSGTLASSYAKADEANIRRDMRRADVLGGSLSGLNAEQSELKDKLNEIVMLGENLGIRALEELTRLTNDTLDFMAAAIKLIPGLEDALKVVRDLGRDSPDVNTAWMTFFQDVSDGKFDGKRPGFISAKPKILEDADHNEVFGK